VSIPNQGADIPGVMRTVQFMVPPSLLVWIQRSGRAGRNGEAATSYLLVEPSVLRKVSRKKQADKSGSESDEEETKDDPTYQKKVEPALRSWIEALGCRRDVADKYFNNPVRDSEGIRKRETFFGHAR
jgi:superfamily II DNA helicase RecQ